MQKEGNTENLLKLWLPIGAFLISIVSLSLSVTNMRFTKRFESAKKRTELLSMLLDGMAVLRTKKEQLLSVKELCHTCPKSQSEQICSAYGDLITSLGHVYEEIEEMTKITDPTKVEHILARQGKLNRDMSDFTAGIDSFIKKCKECEEHPTGALSGETVE